MEERLDARRQTTGLEKATMVPEDNATINLSLSKPEPKIGKTESLQLNIGARTTTSTKLFQFNITPTGYTTKPREGHYSRTNWALQLSNNNDERKRQCDN